MSTGPRVTMASSPTPPPGRAHPPAIEARDVRRWYRSSRSRARSPAATTSRRALDGLSFELESGAHVALLGPNGAGKSTLLRILATLDTRYEGSVRALGRDLRGSDGAAWCRSRLGVVFQRPALDRLLTVREVLELQGAVHAIDARARAARAAAVADLLAVSDRLDDRIGSLSGGLARRADLARALVPHPEILLLDEATSGLDHEARASFLDVLDRLRTADSGQRPTILMSTHLIDEAERADRVLMMHEGRIVADGSPTDLRKRLGGWIVTCDDTPAARDALAARALRPASTHAGSLHAALDANADPSAIQRLAGSLAELGVGFSITRPTLGDAYLALTGAALDTREPAEP